MAAPSASASQSGAQAPPANGSPIKKRKAENGAATVAAASKRFRDERTDRRRWRLRNERGKQTWHYLEDDEEAAQWPQSTADKLYLGLDTGLPELPPAHTPLDSIQNGLSFFSEMQEPPGNWACEYGGPMFLLPGIVITWYVTKTPLPAGYAAEIRNYLFARQNRDDGGWGLHIEGESSVFSTGMQYTVLRLLGADPEDPRMVRARGKLVKLGGALNGPHWSKWWLAVLGVADWDLVNPAPPELWLLPDWVPIAPWRWWIHMRQVFLPMSYIYSKRWSYEDADSDPVILALRQELFIQEHASIDWQSHRNDISPFDNYHPKSWVLNGINWLLVNVWNPYLRTDAIKQRAEAWTWTLIQAEDENSDFADLAPVNAAMNTVACYIHDGPDSYSMRRHRERLHEFMWMKDEGMLTNGTNGLQTWDTSFAIQAIAEAGLASDPRWKPVLERALGFLEDQQMRTECHGADRHYRHSRKGAWGFSTREQGYTVSDTTSEALKSVMLLQDMPGYAAVVSEERIRDAVDVILSMQNSTGGVASYELRRASPLMEWLNAAEVFGNIMVEYDYPECTTSCVAVLNAFKQHCKLAGVPVHRAADVDRFLAAAVKYIRDAQRADGSWYGSWGVCFTYAGIFALESLRSVGEQHANSERVRRACAFFVDRQNPDGGWGESYKSCETGRWVAHPEGSQIVNTAWACIALLEAGYPDAEESKEGAPVPKGVIRRGIELIMRRQRADGSWPQEGIEGVFNKSCMISYPNYKYTFSIKALGMYMQKYGNGKLQ